MNQYWTAHLQTDEEKQRFINQLYGARDVLERLQHLIEMKEYDLGAAERSIKAYETPSWAFLQAHKNGYASAMKVIKNLITLDQEKQ